MSFPPFENTTTVDEPGRDVAAFVPVQRAIMPAPRPRAPRVAPTDAGSFGRHREDGWRPLTGLPGPSPRQRGGRRRARRGHASTFAPADRRPVIGAHRRPGTLPIESWLLIGRHWQQASVAALVVAGLFLIIVPTQQRTADLAAVSAAQRRAAAAAAAAASDGAAAPSVKSPDRARARRQDRDPRSATVPTDAAPAGTSTGEPETPAEDVPPGAETPGATDVPIGRRGSGPADSVRRTGSTTVALTFDDGPDPVQTPKLLALLKQNNVKATFCLVGEQVQAHPDLVREIVAGGHALCNHSWNHSLKLGKLKTDAIRADLERTNAAIRAAVPDAEIVYFRAPGGNFTGRLVGVTDELAMTPLYWEVDPRDWDQPAEETDAQHVDRVVATVQKQVRRGSIVLSHDYHQPNTIAAYEILLPRLAGRFQLGLP
jgi:peptidoglycan/xylan/chitin deacetylase (PgdA/CDA1 family)